MGTDKVYYKSTVKYVLGVRRFIGDSQGQALTWNNPVIEVEVDKLRDFKLANKAAILGGLLMQVDEPVIEWETTNAFTEEEISELTKSYMSLKAKLPKIDSLPVLYKLLEDAKANDRTKKTLQMIETRIQDLEVEDTFSQSPDEMQGVSD